MTRIKPPLFPVQEKILKRAGENIRLARLRRNMTAAQAAERAGISRTTLYKVENADPGVAVGIWLKVLFVLGLERDMLGLARDDILGRKLQDAKLMPGKRASRVKK